MSKKAKENYVRIILACTCGNQDQEKFKVDGNYDGNYHVCQECRATSGYLPV